MRTIFIYGGKIPPARCRKQAPRLAAGARPVQCSLPFAPHRVTALLNPPPAAPTRLTATLVGEHFRFRCPRLLRYGLTPPEARGEGVPDAVPAAGSALLMRAGRRWESRATRRAVERFGADRVRCAGWAEDGSPLPLSPDDTLATLRDPGRVALLVQPTLRLGDAGAFRQRFGIPAEVEIAAAQPDLLRVRLRRDGTPVWGIVDIKGSRRAHPQHFAQIAFYALLLEEIWRAGEMAGVPEPRWGWVWTRGAGRPQRFLRAPYAFHVERLLRGDLAAIASRPAAEAAWHLAAPCGRCRFAEQCRAEADRTDDLARVAGVTATAKALLHERGVRTVSDLARANRRDLFHGCHALETGETRLRKQAQALTWNKPFPLDGRAPQIGPGEWVRVLLSAAAEPVRGLCFALAVRVEGPAAIRGRWVWTAARPGRAAERELLAAALERLRPALAAAEGRDSRQRGAALGVFVPDAGELGTFRELLQRHLGDPGLAEGIAAVVAALAPAGGGPSPVAAVVEAATQLWALPFPYAPELDGVAAALSGGEPSAPARIPAWVRIHTAWRSPPASAAQLRAQIEREMELRLERTETALAALRERSTRRGADRLRRRPPAPPVAEAPLRHPALESLRVFTRLESAAAEANTRALHALPEPERARRWECIRGLELAERRPDGRLVFEFDPKCRDAKFRPGDFALVLTNEGSDTLARLADEEWLRRQLSAELVEYDLSCSPPRLVLAVGSGFARAEAEGNISLGHRCVLDRAGTDWATDRLLGTLAALDTAAAPGERVAVQLLEGRPAAPHLLDVAAARADTLQVAEARRGAPVLNTEQARGWQAAFGEAISLVWGPPGTGKTYLLAWIVLGLAAGLRRAGLPCRVGVCAATHRAVSTLLLRLAAENGDAGVPLRLAKLRGSGSDTDAELAYAGVELLPDGALPGLLSEAAEGSPLVVGCTAWSLWKQMRAMRGGGDAPPLRPCFDVVVIDEASQMTVAQSLVALSALREGGRAILGGDHRQLAPVLRLRPGPDAPGLWGSAFEHFARLRPPEPLRESRRMNGPLTAYPRELFYPGFHSHHPARRIRVETPEAPATSQDTRLAELFLDPRDAVVLCCYRGPRAAARNLWEARLAARLVRLLRERLRDPVRGTPYTPERFVAHGAAVIAPHRAQNAAILAELRAAGWPPGELPVADTVERMQGNEREAIVVSYGVADREYAEAEAEFLLDPRRFNVAITRARSKLIVLLSEEVLEALPHDEEVAVGAMAVQGYPAHCTDAVSEVELPGFGGEPVRATLRFRRLRADAGS